MRKSSTVTDKVDSVLLHLGVLGGVALMLAHLFETAFPEALSGATKWVAAILAGGTSAVLPVALYADMCGRNPSKPPEPTYDNKCAAAEHNRQRTVSPDVSLARQHHVDSSKLMQLKPSTTPSQGRYGNTRSGG